MDDKQWRQRIKGCVRLTNYTQRGLPNQLPSDVEEEIEEPEVDDDSLPESVEHCFCASLYAVDFFCPVNRS